MQPTRIRQNVDLYSPMIMHRLLVLVPVAFGVWNLTQGKELPLLFWAVLGATVLFHLLAKVTPFLRLSPTGLKFVQSETPEILWSDLKQVKSNSESMELEMLSGEVVEIPFARLRRSDADQLREIVKGQVLAMSHEAKALMKADPITAVVNTSVAPGTVAPSTLPPTAELNALLDVTPQQTTAPA